MVQNIGSILYANSIWNMTDIKDHGAVSKAGILDTRHTDNISEYVRLGVAVECGKLELARIK